MSLRGLILLLWKYLDWNLITLNWGKVLILMFDAEGSVNLCKFISSLLTLVSLRVCSHLKKEPDICFFITVYKASVVMEDDVKPWRQSTLEWKYIGWMYISDVYASPVIILLLLTFTQRRINLYALSI